MTNKNLYDSILHILRKESKGLAVSPDAFSDLLRDENIALFNEYYRAFEAGQVVTDALRPFKAVTQLETSFYEIDSCDYASLPSDYFHATAIVRNPNTIQSFSWTSDAHADGYGTFDTVTPSTIPTYNLTSLISSNAAEEVITNAFTVDAGAYFILRATVTDETVSGDSDMPQLYFVVDEADGTPEYMVAGQNYFNVSSVLGGDMYIVLRKELGESVHVSITFRLEIMASDDVGKFYPVDIVTDEEWIFRRRDALTVPSWTYPIARISGEYLYVSPIFSLTTAPNLILHYLKAPSTPFFDYYYDDDYNIQYLSASGTHLLTTGETGRLGETAGSTVTSSTVELEWEDTEKIKILHRIVTKLGVSMDEQLVAQYATAKEKE
jgi:hypothetical protein